MVKQLFAWTALSLALLSSALLAQEAELPQEVMSQLEPVTEYDFDPDSQAALKKKHPQIEPTIPMDRGDPTYSLWRMQRKDLGRGREPGPIDIQRMPGGSGYTGIPTFFRLPVALTPEDLKAGDVDIALLSAHTNMGLGSRGAQWGPNALRASQGDYLMWGAFTMPHMETMVDPFADMVMVDYGDAPTDPLSAARSNAAVRAVIREVIEVERSDGTHVIPMVVGGDHSLSYPSIAAATDVYGKGEVGVIHFDAHFDGSMLFGHLASHGSWVKQLIDEGHVPGKNYIQVGLRGYFPDAPTFEWMRENEFRYHTMAEVDRRGWDAVLEDVVKEAQEGPKYLYISFDIDTIDPAYAPGTGTAEPGGITNRQAFRIVRRLCAESNVIGMDLLEVAPELDPTRNTVLNANRLLRECMVGIALRKSGIDEPDYLSPLTVDDSRR